MHTSTLQAGVEPLPQYILRGAMMSHNANIQCRNESRFPNLCPPFTQGMGSPKPSQLPLTRLPLPGKPLFNRTTTAFRNIA